VDVLVDTIVPPRTHEHAEEGISSGADVSDATSQGLGTAETRLSGRTRQNKLVHLAGSPSMLGSVVSVRIEHAGPYALRGAPVAGPAGPAA
jgi:hypothetical protein